MNITILHSNNYSPNEIHFLYPLYKYHYYFKKNADIKLSFAQDLKKINSDVVMISSKFFSGDWRSKGSEFIIAQLQEARKYTNKIIWCDISDSTGTTHFKVLPYVDSYLKNQVLTDKCGYLKKYYGARIYSDYMHNTFHVNDLTEDEAHLNYIPEEKYLEKIKCGWNSGLAYFGRYRQQENQVFKYSPRLAQLFKIKWVSPFSDKKIKCSCRIGTSYSRDTIALSRILIKKVLEDRLPLEKLSHRYYHQELEQSISAITPFGLGEISLRDFEVMINGAAMIKQDMSHVETWPNLWINNKTYLPFNWDLSDISNQVEFAMDHVGQMRELAYNAQTLYKEILDSDNSAGLFLNHFLNIIRG